MPTESKPASNLPSRITVTEAATMAGVPRRTMLWRLRQLDRGSGGILLHRMGPGRSKWWVDSSALLDQLRNPSDIHRGQMGELRARLEELDRRVTALRGAHRGLTDRFEVAEKNHLAFQEACTAVLQSIGKMVALSDMATLGKNAQDSAT